MQEKTRHDHSLQGLKNQWFESQIAISSLIWTSSVFAHTIFQRVHVNGVDQGYLKGVRHPTYNGPITDVTSNDIICNGGPNPLVTPYPTDIINIPAGSPAAIQYNNVLQPNGWDPTNPADPVDPSHKGPVMVYMAKVPSALQADVTGLGWFKIFEDGYDGSQWGVDRMVANHGIVNFTVPACIPPGNYFLRAEMIALHPASSYPGAQFYPGCAQVNIVGGGSTQPSTVSLPGAYHGADPGITINIYYPPVTNYTIPGPRPFTCNGSSGSTTRSSTTTSTSTKTSTTTTTTTTTTKTTSSTTSSSSPRTSTTSTRTSSTTTSTTSAVGGYASHYAQCGGIGYTGPTVCESPYTCKYSNDYYSQCL